MASRVTKTASSNKATVRSIHDRALRAQSAYLVRLREALEALQPLLEENDADAARVGRAIEAEIAHVRYGTAIVDE